MSGIERRASGGVAGHGDAAGAPPGPAVPLAYTFGPDTACMEGLLDQVPDTLRRAVSPYVDLHRLPEHRWYVERSNGTYTFLAVGDSQSVLASCRQGTSAIRRVFESGRLRVLGPDEYPPHPVATTAGDGGAVVPEDAPSGWSATFAQLPEPSQRLFVRTFPPSRRAARFPGACMDHDRSRERIWVFAGTRSEVVLVHAHRSVVPDRASPRSTEQRLRLAPWRVWAWHGKPDGGNSRPQVGQG